MTTQICVHVFAEPLKVIIRSPSHSVPSCDRAPLLIFSTLGAANVCGGPECVRAIIDGEEVSISRIGEAYGYDSYGGYGDFDEDVYGYGYGCGEEYGYGYGYGYGDGYGDGYGFDPEGYGEDNLPGVLHVFELPELENGRHTLLLIVQSTSGLETRTTETFIIDDEGPEINIISPEDDTINPISECPTLVFEVSDFSGVATVNVNIDGVDFGWLASGTVLTFLTNGLHVLTITANDIATQGCPNGNETTRSVSFNVLKPIEIDEIPRRFFIGTDSSTMSRSGEGIFEELRILNEASTDAEVLDDFKLLRARIRFQLREGEAALSADEVLTLGQIGVEASRINLPDETLLLCPYDTNVDSLDGVGDLAQPKSQIVDPLVAGRRVDITVFFVENTFVDRELITDTINRIIPAFVIASITFEAVPAT